MKYLRMTANIVFRHVLYAVTFATLAARGASADS